MGIKDLNKNLISINALISNKYNSNLLKQLYPVFCKNDKNINGFICHIDMSLLIYRVLYSFDNMEDVYQNLKNRLTELKLHNKIFLYLEPNENKRKEETHKERSILQNKIKTGIQQTIKKEIELFDIFKKDIEPLSNININKPLLDAIGFNKANEKKQYLSPEEYGQKIKIINKENDMYISSDTKTRDKLMLVEEHIFNHGFSTVDEDSDDNNEITEDNKQTANIDEDDDIVEELSKDHKEYNVVKDKKQLFQFFLYETPMSCHHNYLRQRLLDDNVITQEELISSSSFDGEINIVYNIKNNFINKKNLIISTDQDCILFALLHHNTKYIYLKSNILLNPEDITIIKNNYLTKNIAILSAFFNKTDYFKGVHNAGITPCRIEKYLSETSIFHHKLSLEEIIATYILWFIKKNKNKTYETPTYDFKYMKSYFEDFQSYINMEEIFYKSNKKFNRIEIDDVHNYFLTKDQIIPYINDNNPDQLIYKKYSSEFN